MSKKIIILKVFAKLVGKHERWSPLKFLHEGQFFLILDFLQINFDLSKYFAGLNLKTSQ